MRLFKIFIVLTLLIFAKNSFAQFTAGGYMYGSGMYGGMQSCPYAHGGGSSGNSIDSLEARIEAIQDKKEEWEDEQGELTSGDHEHIGHDQVPFKDGVATGLAALVSQKESTLCDKSNMPAGADDLMNKVLGAADQSYWCENGKIKEDKICKFGYIYENNDKFDRNVKYCLRFLDRYDELNQKIAKAEAEIDKLERKRDKLQDKLDDQEYKAWESGRPMPPEGTQCVSCMIGYPEPEAPGWKQIFTAGLIDVGLNFGAYKLGQYRVNKAADLGWQAPPAWASLPGPMATASLFANRGYGGGMGSGFMGCSPGAGYAWGPNGGYGSAYGNMSPYGSCGGAFGSPCGGPGFGAYAGMGGGIFPGGVGPGGMSGPWGGGGFYPNPFGMPGGGFGAGIGGGIGIGGFPGGYGGMGGFGGPMGGGFGGGLGFPGGGFGMGGYPGMYPGGGGFGLGGGLGGGFGFPGMGGGFGMGGYPGGGFGMGGYPGMYPGGPGFGIGGGLGMGGYPGMGGGFGMGGMNPYGGMGGPFGGIGGGFGLGGGMPGMGGPFGGMPGMGMGGLGGADYQMQMMQMQMQQYQAYYQAQQRAFQNQQVVTQQLYGLQSEYMQIQQRYQYLMQQLYSGGGGGFGFGGSFGMGGVGGVGLPPSGLPGTPPSTGPVPTR